MKTYITYLLLISTLLGFSQEFTKTIAVPIDKAIDWTGEYIDQVKSGVVDEKTDEGYYSFGFGVGKETYYSNTQGFLSVKNVQYPIVIDRSVWGVSLKKISNSETFIKIVLLYVRPNDKYKNYLPKNTLISSQKFEKDLLSYLESKQKNVTTPAESEEKIKEEILAELSGNKQSSSVTVTDIDAQEVADIMAKNTQKEAKTEVEEKPTFIPDPDAQKITQEVEEINKSVVEEQQPIQSEPVKPIVEEEVQKEINSEIVEENTQKEQVKPTITEEISINPKEETKTKESAEIVEKPKSTITVTDVDPKELSSIIANTSKPNKKDKKDKAEKPEFIPENPGFQIPVSENIEPSKPNVSAKPEFIPENPGFQIPVSETAQSSANKENKDFIPESTNIIIAERYRQSLREDDALENVCKKLETSTESQAFETARQLYQKLQDLPYHRKVFDYEKQMFIQNYDYGTTGRDEETMTYMMLGTLYNGSCLNYNIQKSVQYFEKAARNQNVEAMMNLADYYEYKEGWVNQATATQSPNKEKELFWLQQATNLQYLEARQILNFKTQK